MRKKVVNFCIKTLEITLKIMLAISLLFILLNLNKYYHVNDINMFIVFAFILFIIGILVGYQIVVKKYIEKLISSRRKLFYWIISIIVIILQIIFVKNANVPIGWDVGAIFRQIEVGDYSWYFIQYPNNLLLLVLLDAWCKLLSFIGITNIWLAADLLNILVIDVAIVCTCTCGYKIFGEKGLFYTYVVSIVILGLSPYLIIPYSDTFSLMFPPLLLLLTLQFLDAKTNWKRLCIGLAYGIVLCSGFSIKPTILIVGIATVVIILLKEIKLSWLKKTIFFIVIASTVVGCLAVKSAMTIATPYVLGSTPSKEDVYMNSYPMTHFMMMGLRSGEGLYGAYNPLDDQLTQSISGKDNKKDTNIREIKSRIMNLGVSGVLRHFVNKYVWVTTDGTFYYGGEGNFINAEKTGVGLRGMLENYTYWDSAFYKNVVTNFQQAVWVLLLFFMVCAQSSKFFDEKKSIVILIGELTLFGVFLFLILFEARSRYLIPFLPLIILLSASGFQRINQIVMKSIHGILSKKG